MATALEIKPIDLNVLIPLNRVIVIEFDLLEAIQWVKVLIPLNRVIVIEFISDIRQYVKEGKS